MSKKAVVSQLVKRDGWYKNEKGELCYEGQCFVVRQKPNGECAFEFDDSDPACNLELVKQARLEVMSAAICNRVVFRGSRTDK